jgi:hypothetical protein
MADDKKVEVKQDTNVVIYIGNDEGFFEGIKKDLVKSYSVLNFEFLIFDPDNISEQQNLVVDLPGLRPKIIFIDYTREIDNYVHMTRLINRMNFIRRPVMMGLCDLKDLQNVCQRVVINGVQAVHVKSDDLIPIVFDSINLAFPDSREDHEYAKAAISDRANALWPGKLSFLSKDGVHIESNIPLKAGAPCKILTYWHWEGIIPAPNALVADSTQEDLYYNYDYGQDIALEYFPPVKHFEDESEAEYQEKEDARLEKIERVKSKLQAWLNKNAVAHKPKDLKVMVVDKSFKLLQNQPRTDKYPFVLRCQPYIKNMMKELQKVKPHLIIFEMEEVSKEELAANPDLAYIYNESRTLQYMIKCVNKIQNFHPFVIIFNAKNYSKEHLQQALNYKQLMVHKGSIDPEVVKKMAEVLIARINSNKQEEEESEEVEILVLDKDHPATYVEISKTITILSISEMDLFFSCNEEIRVGTVLHLKHPIDMYVTVALTPVNSEFANEYYAVIHGVGEDLKKDLRRYVNSVFFKDLEEQKRKEKEEVDNLKKKYQEEQEKQKIAAQKKKEEEEAKKKKEEEEKAKKAAEDKEKLLQEQAMKDGSKEAKKA